MSQLAETSRTKLKRRAQRGSFDRAVVNAILDEGFLCHVAFVHQGQPALVPTVYARGGDWLYVHGARANRAWNALLEPGREACVSVTHVDALVLARSAFHHSVNYRSVILYGQGQEVVDADEKLEALRLVVEHAIPGRWKDVRWPNEAEFRQTLVVKLPIDEGSAKIRATGVLDDEDDLQQGCWAGLLPVRTQYGPAERDPLLPADVALPAYVERYARPGR